MPTVDRKPPARRASPPDPVADTLKHLKLRHLSCALDVARTGSVRGAAEALHVTESAVSKTLRELEEQLGVRLFERTKKGMTLTESGRQFAGYAQSALDALHTGVSLASGDRAVPPTVVRIAAMTVVTAAFLPELVRRFLAAHADSLVEIVAGSGAALLDRLRRGQVEIVLGRCPPRKDLTGLAFEPLYIDRHVFVVRAGHPLATLGKVAPSRISAFPIVMPPRESPFWEEIHQFFVARGVHPRAARVEVLDLQFSRAYTLSSDAVWIGSERAVGADIAAGALVRLPITAPSFEASVGVITRRSGAGDAKQDELLRLTREASARFS